MKHARTEDALLTRMAQTIARHGLFASGERVLAAVSGGVDSMVMLHGLRRLGYAVEAAHFDHQTRNGASADDAAFVREACAQLEVPCCVGSEAVEADALNAGKSFEAHARERRYAFLLNTARKKGCSVIATGHHEDDQAETLLMGMLGVTSGFGATGIAPRLEWEGIRIARPMLDCNRATIESWARENGIAWRDDLTNREPHCARNRMRLELLPALDAHYPHSRRALARFADLLRVDGEYLDALAEQALAKCVVEQEAGIALNRQAFRDAPEALQRRMVKLLARRVGTSIGYERIMGATRFIVEAATGKQFQIGGGATLSCCGEKIRLYPAGQHPSPQALPPTPIRIPGETCVGDYVFRTRFLQANALPVGGIRAQCSPTRQYFDADVLAGELYVRSRQPGDRMVPLGMEHARKVQDIMTDLRIPAFQRDAVPLLLRDADILWVAGHTRSNIATVGAETTTLLEIELRRRD